MSTIKSGREADAAVAEKLGCWKDADGIWWTRHWTQAKAKMYASAKFQLLGADYNNITTLPRFSESTNAAIAALEATGRPWCVMKCGEEEKGWTTAAYIARITDPEMEWSEAPTLCLAASAAILAWAAAKGGK